MFCALTLLHEILNATRREDFIPKLEKGEDHGRIGRVIQEASQNFHQAVSLDSAISW